MATKQDFVNYMTQNEANLNKEALKGADLNMIYNEWRDTGTISKNYLNPTPQVVPQNNTQQPQPNIQQPNTQQPNIQQEQPVNIPNQVQQTQTQPIQTQQTPKTEPLPQTTAPKTVPKPNEVPTLETPKYQKQLDKFLETSDFATAMNKLKEGLANGTIDQATFNKAESAIWEKIKEQSQVGRDENSMFNALKTGQKIPSQFTNTPEALRAQARFDVANKYQGMTEEQLYNAYLNGEISSQLEQDIATNPYLTLAKERFNKKLATDNINNEAITILNSYNKANGGKITTKTEKTALENLNDRFLTMFENMGKSENEILDFKSYMATNYPDLVTQTTELNAKNMQLKNLADERDARLDEIIKENPGISINRATMLAARQNKDINKQIQSMSYEIANLASNIQYQTAMADKEYGYMLQAQARQDQLAQEQRGYMFDYLKGEQSYLRGLEAEQRQREYQLEAEQRQREYQLEDRQYQEELEMRRMQQQYDFTYGDFNSEDPRIRDTAIRNAVAQLYIQYPIPGMEAPAVKEQKVKDLMAQGLTGEQAISQLEQEIRNTNRYKQMIAGTSNFGFQNVGNGTIAVTDPMTGQVRFESIQNVGNGISREQAISTYGSTPAVRNFNPGNITDTGFGGKKVEGERFTRFDTPQEGFSALVAKIQNIQAGNSKVYSPNMSILEYISKYAPASDNNNPQAYANAIAKDLGVPVNTRIGELDPVKLASAHAKHEDRNSYRMLLDLGIIKEDGSLGQMNGGPTSGGATGDYYSQFRVTQDVGAKSPNSKDTGWNGGTPGIDFAMPVGTDVIATVGGKVVLAQSNKDYGTQVIIEDENGNQHMYSHLSEGLYNVGDRIQAGQVIAKSGNTGFSTGPHLDYRVKGADGKWIDPKQFLGGGEKEYTTTQKAIMDQYLKNPASQQNIDALQNAGLTTNDIESYKTITAGLGILGVPLSYERGIKNMVPATLMNSEVELAQLNETIKAMAKAGYSQEEAALTYMGFDVEAINEQDNMDFALKTIDVASSLGLNDDKFKNVVSRVNNFLKRGEEGQVIKLIETEAQRELKAIEGDNYISDSQINFSKQALDKLQLFIAKNSDKIGPVSGRFSDLSKKFKNDPEYQALTTLLQGSLAEVRRAFAGTAVTETELKAIRDFVGLDTKMPIQNLQSALNTNFESMLMNYNAQRQFVGLPEMTPEYVGSNWNQRVDLYKGTSTQNTSTGNTGQGRWQISQGTNTGRWQNSQ